MQQSSSRSSALGAAISVLLLVAGCGGAGTGDDPADPGAANGTPQATTHLTIVVEPGPQGPRRTYTLTCTPPGGDHPDPQAACRALDAMEDPFAPVPPDTACAQVFGGPQRATVSGTFEGAPVKARFDRTDGCQIARWDAHSALLVEPGGVGTSPS